MITIMAILLLITGTVLMTFAAKLYFGNSSEYARNRNDSKNFISTMKGDISCDDEHRYTKGIAIDTKNNKFINQKRLTNDAIQNSSWKPKN